MEFKFVFFAVSLPLITASAVAQSYDLQKLVKDNALTTHNRTITPSQSGQKNSVKLDEKEGEGMVWINGIKFSTGIIEIDLHGQDVLQKSFVGIAFHGENNETYEAVYFRPFNFHASDPVRKIHAVQYISHPLHTWSKLREEQNGKYEKSVNNAPDPNGWFHARIEVSPTEISVFVNDAKEPDLRVERLNSRKDGMLGLWVGNGSPGEFANLKIKVQ